MSNITGTFVHGADWCIDDYGNIEIFHMEEQQPLYLVEDDVNNLVIGLARWKEEKIIKDAKDRAAKEKQDYADYLRLKERFETK